MSIEMENPVTVYEKIDAAANLVEQMMLAHSIKDETTFKAAHKKAGDFLFQAMRQIEDAEETMPQKNQIHHKVVSPDRQFWYGTFKTKKEAEERMKKHYPSDSYLIVEA